MLRHYVIGSVSFSLSLNQHLYWAMQHEIGKERLWTIPPVARLIIGLMLRGSDVSSFQGLERLRQVPTLSPMMSCFPTSCATHVLPHKHSLEALIVAPTHPSLKGPFCGHVGYANTTCVYVQTVLPPYPHTVTPLPYPISCLC